MMRFIYRLLRGICRIAGHTIILTIRLLALLFLIGIGPFGWVVLAVLIVMDEPARRRR